MIITAIRYIPNLDFLPVACDKTTVLFALAVIMLGITSHILKIDAINFKMLCIVTPVGHWMKVFNSSFNDLVFAAFVFFIYFYVCYIC